MSASIKAVLAGAALVGVGGTGVWILYSESMPLGRPLVKDVEFLDSDNAQKPKDGFKGKYAADKARFLVGTGADVTTSKPRSNSDGGDWSFNNRYKREKSDKFKGGFKDLNKGSKAPSGDTNIKSLQEACESAYKSDTAKVKTTDPAEGGTDEFNEDHVGFLCSALGSKPKTVGDFSGDNNSEDYKKQQNGDWKDNLGSSKKADLLAIYYEGNETAWKILDMQYQLEKPNEGFFKFVESKDIKGKCEEAYKQNSVGTEDTKPKEDDLYKGCSLRGYKESSS